MVTFGLVMMIIGALLMVGSFTYLVLKVKKMATALSLEIYNIRKEFMFFALIAGFVGVGSLLFFLGIPYYWQTPNLTYEWVCIVFGGFLIGFEFSCFYTTFRLHYYQKKFSKNVDKWLYFILLGSGPLMILTIWLLTEGYANHMTYPLINGISFNNGFHFSTAKTMDANLAWYALCILGGAVLVYFMCDHFSYQEYGKHGIVDSTFLVAFPAGVIGARIFYVIGNWKTEFGPYFETDPFKMFRMWEGGLTILGGAITGIVVGILWFHWRNKDIKIGKAVNIIVPTILIAQAVGRWGNFFNAEVHGAAVSGEAWQWLPTIIYNQMTYSSAHRSFLPDGQIYVPLFLIESIVNVIGYYVLFFVIGKGFKKYVKGGDLALGYLIWYGMTRCLMEPLRDPSFNMGKDGRWSWIWSIIFIGVGLLAIIVNHVIRFIYKDKKQGIVIQEQDKPTYRRNAFIGIGVCLLVSLTMFITGLFLYLNNTLEGAITNIELVPHNVGLILWIIGLCLIPSISIPILYLYKVYQKPILKVE